MGCNSPHLRLATLQISYLLPEPNQLPGQNLRSCLYEPEQASYYYVLIT